MRIWKNKIWILLSLILLVVILGLLSIFNPHPEEPKRIEVLIDQNTPTTENFLDGLRFCLAKQGYYQGKNLSLHVENLRNTEAKVPSILKKLKNKRVDLIITTGKDVTIVTARVIINKPIIFALVTDPMRDETMKNLIDKLWNVTGVSYFTPYDRTLDLSKRIIPNFKKLVLAIPEGYFWPDLDKLKTAARDAEKLI